MCMIIWNTGLSDSMDIYITKQGFKFSYVDGQHSLIILLCSDFLLFNLFQYMGFLIAIILGELFITFLLLLKQSQVSFQTRLISDIQHAINSENSSVFIKLGGKKQTLLAFLEIRFNAMLCVWSFQLDSTKPLIHSDSVLFEQVREPF